MLIIGICGASGSGKSTLAKSLAARLEKPCIYIKQDSYYRDHPDMSFEERERLNYDEPGIFEHDLLREDLLRLREGRPITTKEYDYANHRRCDPGALIQPADVVLLEGKAENVGVLDCGEMLALSDQADDRAEVLPNGAVYRMKLS